MSRQLEQAREEQQRKREKKLARIVEYELEGALAHAGALLHGFSVRIGAGDCLMTIRASLAGRRQVAYVGGETFASVLLKAAYDARHDRLTWKADKYAK